MVESYANKDFETANDVIVALIDAPYYSCSDLDLIQTIPFATTSDIARITVALQYHKPFQVRVISGLNSGSCSIAKDQIAKAQQFYSEGGFSEETYQQLLDSIREKKMRDLEKEVRNLGNDVDKLKSNFQTLKIFLGVIFLGALCYYFFLRN